MAKVSPELQAEIEDYLQKRERGEVSLLSFFYKEVFKRDLKVNCGGCIEEAIRNLKNILNPKSITMENYKWIGGDKRCFIREHGKTIEVNKNTCNDRLAELVSGIGKYCHLVEEVKKISVVKERFVEVPKFVAEKSATSEDTILISEEVKTEEVIVKKKRGRPALK